MKTGKVENVNKMNQLLTNNTHPLTNKLLLCQDKTGVKSGANTRVGPVCGLLMVAQQVG